MFTSLPEVPKKSSMSLFLVLVRPSGLSVVGKEVKLRELHDKTKWSVLGGGRGWGEE